MCITFSILFQRGKFVSFSDDTQRGSQTLPEAKFYVGFDMEQKFHQEKLALIFIDEYHP